MNLEEGLLRGAEVLVVDDEPANVALIESMCAGVSTPSLRSFFALLASAICSPEAPTPILLVAACADSAAPLIRSRNPIGVPPFVG